MSDQQQNDWKQWLDKRAEEARQSAARLSLLGVNDLANFYRHACLDYRRMSRGLAMPPETERP